MIYMLNIMKKMNLKGLKHHYVLALLFAAFVVLPIQLPEFVAEMVNTTLGKVVVIILALNLFLVHPVVGSMGVLAAYELIKRAEHTVIRNPTNKYIPSEAKKTRELTKMNQFPVTVEEMVIAKQIPYVFNTSPSGGESYKPVQGKLQGAAKI